jgi:hypothetical protein
MHGRTEEKMTKRYVLIDDSESDAEETTLELGPTYGTSIPVLPEATGRGGITPLRQTCTWSHATTSGLYGPTYEDVDIRCRFSQESEKVKKPNNQEVISNAMIRCLEPIGASDKITYNDIVYPVLSVKAITGIGGGLIEYEVRL